MTQSNPLLDDDLKKTKTAFYLYMLLIFSFFTHLTARIPALGMIRMDFLLILVTFLLTFTAKTSKQEEPKVAFYIKTIFIYSLLVLPFTTWPGSVLKLGIPNLLKATMFFYFTYRLILTEKRFAIMVYLFVFVNTFRILEPLYLHFTDGYWGQETTTYGEEQVDRLSGAPKDVIGPNGLAFVIATVLPFYHYLFGTRNFLRKMVYWGILPALLFTMAITLSRSGILAVVLIYGAVFFRSKRKALLLILGICGAAAFFASLNDVQRDRYLSMVSHKTKSSASADGRVTGWYNYLDVALMKPVFGHGLGTSGEANLHFSGRGQPAHNLWLEVLQELGFVGLIIFILYTKESFKLFNTASIAARQSTQTSEFIAGSISAMQVWFVMNLVFSFASYGLSSYEWYLFAGFGVALVRFTKPVDSVETK